MKSLNKNGVSITQNPGEEKYIEWCLGADLYPIRLPPYKQQTFLHSGKTLESCQQKRDEWIKRLEQPPVYILFQTDVNKSKSSRVYFDVYFSELRVIEATKKKDLYTNQEEVVILECEMDNFSDL